MLVRPDPRSVTESKCAKCHRDIGISPGGGGDGVASLNLVSLYSAPYELLCGSYVDVIQPENYSMVMEQEAAQALCRGDVTGPVCPSCFEDLVEVALQQEKEALINHLRRYREFELGRGIDTEESLESMEANLAQDTALEARLAQQLALAESEHYAVNEALTAAVAEGQSLQAVLDSCEAAESVWEAAGFLRQEGEAGAAVREAAVRTELRLLRDLPVLPALFDIQFPAMDGCPCVTINGLHLVWDTRRPVDRDEINAAWGMAGLCLQATAVASGLPLTMFRPLPNGSASTMEELRASIAGHPVRHNLFLKDSTRASLGSFDRGMSAFVVCVYELSERASLSHALPCRVQGDTVMGMSVYLTDNPVEKWAQAVQFLFRSFRRLVEHLNATHVCLY